MPKHTRFGLMRVRSPLLTQSLLFSFPAGNEMFQFPAFAFYKNRIISVGYWVAPFGNPGVKWLFAPNPGLSQLITSFVASKSQGIHRLPFVACLNLMTSWKLKVESWKLKITAKLKNQSPTVNLKICLLLYLFLFCFQYVKDHLCN